jgi:hypothetical protein
MPLHDPTDVAAAAAAVLPCPACPQGGKGPPSSSCPAYTKNPHPPRMHPTAVHMTWQVQPPARQRAPALHAPQALHLLYIHSSLGVGPPHQFTSARPHAGWHPPAWQHAVPSPPVLSSQQAPPSPGLRWRKPRSCKTLCRPAACLPGWQGRPPCLCTFLCRREWVGSTAPLDPKGSQGDTFLCRSDPLPYPAAPFCAATPWVQQRSCPVP